MSAKLPNSCESINKLNSLQCAAKYATTFGQH